MKNILEDDARALMIFDYITLINKLGIFKDKNSIINIGSFDLLQHDNTALGMKLLNSLGLEASEAELSKEVKKRRISSKILWEKLGFNIIKFIDSDGVHDSLAYDFNKDINDELNFYETFDVITNFGTTEHIFNQYAVFNNIHKLCKIDGYMIHSLPIHGGYEHGFYNYHPNFFYALAGANGYEIIYIGVRHEGLENFSLVEMSSEAIEPFLMQINAMDTLGIFVIFKKTNDDIFKVPFQGRYEIHKKNTQ